MIGWISFLLVLGGIGAIAAEIGPWGIAGLVALLGTLVWLR